MFEFHNLLARMSDLEEPMTRMPIYLGATRLANPTESPYHARAFPILVVRGGRIRA